MAQKQKQILRVGAVQMASGNGEIEKNLAQAIPLVEEAARRGAKIILLPEFMPTGYVHTTDIWEAAENREGLTVQWLKTNAKRLNVTIGTSYLEAEGEDFYNTFVLVAPDGTEAGRVRKQTPASFEAYFTKGEAGTHVIDTEVAKIGVSICYESQLSYTPLRMHKHSVDILLMPHSAPTPSASPFFPPNQIAQYHKHLKGVASLYAKNLGIPVVMVNKCGQWESSLPGLPFLSQQSSFPGLTTIADSDGLIKAQMGNTQGIVVEDVVLDPTRKISHTPEVYGRWFGIVPWPTYLFIGIEALGRLWYRFSSRRRCKAHEISSSGWVSAR